MTDNREKIQWAKDHAPSYFNLLDDGAPFRCHECDEESRKGMIVAYTPNGKQATLHYDCADENWIKKATCYGAI